jgi:RNA recognition motif-containing protein
MNIFVGNLSRDVTEDDLINLFAQFGYVKSVKIIKNISTNESKGYGFVEMPGVSEAHKAIDSIHTKELKGKRLTVNEGKLQKFDRGKSKDGSLGYGSNSSKKH